MKKKLPSNKMFQAGPTGPVVMATCVDSEGKSNIITLGMYMVISSNPPLVTIGVAPRRYSHKLIEESGEFVINVPSISLEKEMHYCGIKSGRDVDKFAETGLTPIPAEKVKAPLIKECYGHLECKVVTSYTCGDHTLFVGEVISATVDDEVIDEKLNLKPLNAKPIVQKNHVYFTVTKILT